MGSAHPGGAHQVRDGARIFVGGRPGHVKRLLVCLPVPRPYAAHRPKQDTLQLTRVDRFVDGGRTEAEPLRDRGKREEALGSQELRPPQIRRNFLRGPLSIRSLGWIR